MWIILLFPVNCVSALSCRLLKLFRGSSLATCRLCARAVRANTGHSDSGDEWIERYVWDKQNENEFVVHLSTSLSLDEVTRATTELDVSVDSVVYIFVANILSAA